MKKKFINVTHILILMIAGCFLFLSTGCHHVRGTIVNEQGIPVPYSHVTVYGWRGGMLTGEGLTAKETQADEKGKFDVKLSTPRYIIATSPDGKLSSPFEFGVNSGENIVVVRPFTKK